MADQANVEWLKCSKLFAYFVDTYVNIYNAISGEWVPFKLWPSQILVADTLESDRLVLILKARQLGMTWLCLAYMLWLMLFRPAATVLLFSRRETEAAYLIWRLRNMYLKLPGFMQAREVLTSNTLSFALSNGSIAYAFPTTAGDSYTATAALVDEADLVPDLDALMSAVKPTIDGGGRMMLISRSDKKNPMSSFKNMFRAALKKESPWTSIFLPWFSHPGRSVEWYADIKRDVVSRTGSLDEVYEQYPATPEEALSAVESDKRLSYKHLEKVYQPLEPIEKGPLPYLLVYKRPGLVEEFVIGADPAEGNPKSDDSSATVVNKLTGEEVAVLAGKIEPTIFASYLESLSTMYNRAKVMTERNNHGHVVISNMPPDLLLNGLDDRPGWHTNIKSKAAMYSTVADVVSSKRCLIHNRTTMEQLLSIEGSTLRAPEGTADDYATSFCLSVLGITGIDSGSFTMDYSRGLFVPKSGRRQALVRTNDLQ